MKKKEILFLSPVFKQMLWGGHRLREEFGYEIPGEDTGECWAVSAHPEGDCVIREGRHQGKTLSTLFKECPELFGNLSSDRFPLLVKIIDARDKLSIQVHPDDAYAAKKNDGSSGKMECWYILDCPEDAGLVMGHNAGTKEELEEMIEQGKWGELIREIPVRKGDFLQINPGTVHAVKAGILILETQQSSNTTYRLYDYDRRTNGVPRQLHISQGLEVITVPAASMEDSILHTQDFTVNKRNELIDCEHYRVWKLDVESEYSMEPMDPFLIVSILDGSGEVNGRAIKKGDHFIVPNGIGEVKFHGNMSLILSTAKQKN